jgi:hypothetical protein
MSLEERRKVVDSILDSVKKLLGITSEYTAFDDDITMHINNAFSSLSQIGIGPDEGYSITSSKNTWYEFETDTNILSSAKIYVFTKTKLGFDPPTSSGAMDALERSAKELEWRLSILAEQSATESEDD